MRNDEDYENWLALPNEDAPQISTSEMAEQGFMILGLCLFTVGIVSATWLVVRGIFGG